MKKEFIIGAPNFSISSNVVFNDYIRAIKKALKDNYYLLRKYTGIKENKIQIGIYDSREYCISKELSYELYKNYAKKVVDIAWLDEVMKSQECFIKKKDVRINQNYYVSYVFDRKILKL